MFQISLGLKRTSWFRFYVNGHIPCIFHVCYVSAPGTHLYLTVGVDRQLHRSILVRHEECEGHLRQHPQVLGWPVKLHIRSDQTNKDNYTNTHLNSFMVKRNFWFAKVNFSTWSSQRKWFWPVHTGGTKTAAACNTGNCTEGGSSTENNMGFSVIENIKNTSATLTIPALMVFKQKSSANREWKVSLLQARGDVIPSLLFWGWSHSSLWRLGPYRFPPGQSS